MSKARFVLMYRACELWPKAMPFITTLLFGDPVAGYPTIMVTMLFLGGVQLLSLGIIGEYLGKVFNETKGRPGYFVNSYNGERK